MNVYSIDVKIYGTAYIQAESEEKAQEIAASLKDDWLEVPAGDAGDLEIYGGQFHADMPEVSLSPAMTIHGIEDRTVDLVEENLDEDE